MYTSHLLAVCIIESMVKGRWKPSLILFQIQVKKYIKGKNMAGGIRLTLYSSTVSTTAAAN